MASMSKAPHRALRAFYVTVEELRRATRASRTTLRLDHSEWSLHVDDVAAEALEPGVRSLAGQTSIDQRQADSVRWLDRERRPLVQDDCLAASHPPPQELVDLYGVRAQMLGPIVRGRRLVGWLSVHENRGPRDWSEEDVAALAHAIAAIDAVLDDAVTGAL
jgi:GAF domain-containing protein